jgi:hypothetical protein
MADTIQIHKAAAIKLFTDWHVDEGTSRAEARNYARRLWTRLEAEATEAGIAAQAQLREAERKARAAQPKTLSLHDTIALHHALAPTEATAAHMAVMAKKGAKDQ